MKKRSEMKYLFRSKFGETGHGLFENWIAERNPVSNVKNLPSSLDVLLIYGLSDKRVPMEEQIEFKKALDEVGIKNQLITVKGADHGFDGHFSELEHALLSFTGRG